MHLPRKTFEGDAKSRRVIERHESGETSGSAETSIVNRFLYKHLDDFKHKISSLKLTGWSRKEREEDYLLEYFDNKHALPVYSVRVDSGLGFSIAVFGWFLPDNHQLYLEHKRSLFHVSIASLCNSVISFHICSGLPQDSPATDPVTGVSAVTNHSIPWLTDVYGEDGPPFQVDMVKRSGNCSMLCSVESVDNQELCASCASYLTQESKRKPHVKPVLPIKDSPSCCLQ